MLENRDQQIMDEFMKNDLIADFDVFSSRYQEKLDNDWMVTKAADFILFMRVDICVHISRIIVALKVFPDCPSR